MQFINPPQGLETKDVHHAWALAHTLDRTRRRLKNNVESVLRDYAQGRNELFTGDKRPLGTTSELKKTKELEKFFRNFSGYIGMLIALETSANATPSKPNPATYTLQLLQAMRKEGAKGTVLDSAESLLPVTATKIPQRVLITESAERNRRLIESISDPIEIAENAHGVIGWLTPFTTTAWGLDFSKAHAKIQEIMNKVIERIFMPAIENAPLGSKNNPIRLALPKAA